MSLHWSTDGIRSRRLSTVWRGINILATYDGEGDFDDIQAYVTVDNPVEGKRIGWLPESFIEEFLEEITEALGGAL